MYHKILDFFAGKRIAILGFGMEGKSTYRFIRRYMKDISLTVIDQKNMQLENEALFSLDHSLSFVYGEHYLENLEKYDVIMKSPGISFKDIDISKIRNKIYSQIELLLMFYRDNMIGITGTKGKSTTSTLIYQVLCESGKDTRLVGNIGIPVFDEIEEYTDHTILVVEMSSHQLEYVDFSPHIGIILNLFEDHLDHAGSVEHYYASKMHMFDYQREEDISIYSRDNKNLCEYIKNGNYRSHMYPVQLEYDSNCVSLKGNEVRFQDTVLYVVNNGMEIGSHSYSHKNLDKISDDEMQEEINSTTIIFNEITGKNIELFRPPYGNVSSSTKEKIPFAIVKWNIDTEDWLYRNAEHTYEHIISHACDGCIVLMHEIYKETLEAVKMSIPALQEMGYDIVSVSELAKSKNISMLPGNIYRSFNNYNLPL